MTPGPDLPAEVRRAMNELRELEPSAEVDERLRRALARADRERASRRGQGQNVLGSRVVRGVAALSAAACALLAAEAVFRDRVAPGDRLERVERLELRLRGSDFTWIPLPLGTEHHRGADAEVHLEIPRGVRVLLSDDATAEHGPTCDDERCRHRFGHPTHAIDAPPLRIGVAEKGNYRIFVEHTSSERHVRELFLVDAR